VNERSEGKEQEKKDKSETAQKTGRQRARQTPSLGFLKKKSDKAMQKKETIG